MAAPVGNQYALGNTYGRPARYENPEDLRNEVIAYFTWCLGEFHMEKVERKNPKTKRTETFEIKVWDRDPEAVTTTGLALYLGYASRQSLYDLQKSSEEFSYIIKRALLVIEKRYEQGLDNDRPAGAIFALSNMGWKNSQRHELTGADGKPIETKVTSNVDYDQLPDEVLEAIMKARKAEDEDADT